MFSQRLPRRRTALRPLIVARSACAWLRGGGALGLAGLLTWALLLAVSGPPAAAAGAANGLPSMGVPLSALLRAEPALAGGLQLAGVVRGVAAANSTPPAVAALTARLPRSIGSVIQVRSGQQVSVHRSPGGAIVERFDDRSDSGRYVRAFTVYRLGPPGWLGVSVAALHGRLGWIHVDPAALIARASISEIHVSLQRRTLTLLRGGRVLLRTLVVIGALGSPTPVGHFSVDDKLRFTRADPSYGAGALSLSVPPPGRPWRQWRVAIHGLNNLGRLGGSGSLGCVHVPTRQLLHLLTAVPVGTPVDVTA